MKSAVYEDTFPPLLAAISLKLKCSFGACAPASAFGLVGGALFAGGGWLYRSDSGSSTMPRLDAFWAARGA